MSSTRRIARFSTSGATSWPSFFQLEGRKTTGKVVLQPWVDA
jgi:hypothetical protein